MLGLKAFPFVMMPSSCHLSSLISTIIALPLYALNFQAFPISKSRLSGPVSCISILDQKTTMSMRYPHHPFITDIARPSLSSLPFLTPIRSPPSSTGRHKPHRSYLLWLLQPPCQVLSPRRPPLCPLPRLLNRCPQIHGHGLRSLPITASHRTRETVPWTMLRDSGRASL